MAPGPRAAAVVGVDIGTTSLKAAAYLPDGALLAAAEIAYPLRSPLPGRAEQDPDTILRAVFDGLGQVARAVEEAGEQVAGVAFSAAMHTLIGLGPDGEPVTPVITYADNRAARQAEELRADARGAALVQRTGTPLHPMSPLAKLRWFAEDDPATRARVRRWAGIKEHVLLRLFGVGYLDHSMASSTGLFDLRTEDWDAEALELAGVRPDQLGRLVPGSRVVSGLAAPDASRLGLDPRTPFVVGASDGVLANLGVGAIAEDVVACTVGTSGAVRAVVRQPVTDERGRLFCYALTQDRWVIGGAVNNGGLVLRWLRDALFPEVAEAAQAAGRDPYADLIALGEQAPVGAGGLLLLPYLTGERAPHWSALPRGVLFGLQREHGREHIVRAALEGVMYQLRSVLRLVEEAGVHPREIRATGGFTASPLWCQIMADVFDRPISVAEHHQGSAFGAALLGLHALGLIDSLEVAEELVEITAVHRPVAEHARVHAALQPVFEGLYDHLAGDFAALAALQEQLPLPR